MLGLWAFRFVLWYLLFLMTQPHFRFPILIPLHLGDVLVMGAFGLHVVQSLSSKRPILVFGPATRICLALLSLSLATHYFNPNQRSTAWNVDIDGMVKVSLVSIILEAQVYTVYRAFAVLATMVMGTLWWLKGGLRLAQAGATWGSGDRLMGAHVSIIQNPNDFAYQMSFMLAIYFLGYRLAQHRWQRFAFVGFMAGAAFITLETGSRTGLLALLTVGAAIAFQAWRNGHRKLVLGGIAGLVVLLTAVVSGGNIERFKTLLTYTEDIAGTNKDEGPRVETADDGSARIRFIKIAAAWELICAHPLLGVGTNPHRSVYWRDINAAGMVHNELMMAGRHMGFPGMIVYLCAVVVPFILAGRVVRMARDRWPQVAVFAGTARLCLLVTVVGGFFSPSLFNFPHMMLMVSLVSLHSVVKQDLAAEASRPAWAGGSPAGVPSFRAAGLPV